MKCRICGKISMVMNASYTGKVEFVPGPGTKSFICGICVAYKALRTPEPKCDFEVDLAGWRKQQKMSQKDLANRLMVSKPLVSMVENGRKPMPARWKKVLEGLTNP